MRDNADFYLLVKFYQTLFNEGDAVCWGTDVTCTRSHEWGYTDLFGAQIYYPYFSINSLKGSRKDANVFCYRNILLEFDTITPAAQLEIINQIPHSTLVWSGGKSYHAIISLEEPCETREAYDTLVRRIYHRLPDVDKTAKNPSRFSRSPCAIRDNGEVQRLVRIGNRVSKEVLEAWLGPDTVEQAYTAPTESASRCLRLLSPHTLYFLNFGTVEGNWNRQLFLSTLDMARCGQQKQEIIDKITEITGKLTASDKRTINSALLIVAKE